MDHLRYRSRKEQFAQINGSRLGNYQGNAILALAVTRFEL